MASLIGQTIGNYRVTSMLGEGGMGVVYQAEHPVIGRKVAIKLLHTWMASDAEVVARFFNEARAIHTISHENIVEIMDFGQTTDGQPYFVMEFLAGEAISDRLTREGAMPVPLVSEIADQICRALAAAHGKGIIHRDLKPHNIHLLTSESGRNLAKLLDFGVAKITNAKDLSQSVKTRSGSLMGTPLYMSPEQCKGAGEIDHRTDIYSLGIVLYEMLSGRPPFVSQGVAELFASHLLKAPQPLRELAPGTPPAMAAAVMRALAKNPTERFSTMEDLRQAFLSDGLPISAGGPGSGSTQRYPSNSGRTLIAPSAAGAGHAATTFSSVSSQIDATRPSGKGRTGLVVGALVLAAAAAGTYFLVIRGRGAADQSGSAGAAEEKATGSETTTPAPATPRPAATVMVRFEAEPPGAHVFRTTDDKDLGATPLELTLPRNGGNPTYVFRLDGYQEQTLSADLTKNQTVRANLDKLPEKPNKPDKPDQKAAPPPARAEKAGKGDRGEKADPSETSPRHATTRKTGKTTPIDNDGLANPTF